jgi:hypothetical protein
MCPSDQLQEQQASNGWKSMRTTVQRNCNFFLLPGFMVWLVGRADAPVCCWPLAMATASTLLTVTCATHRMCCLQGSCAVPQQLDDAGAA